MTFASQLTSWCEHGLSRLDVFSSLSRENHPTPAAFEQTTIAQPGDASLKMVRLIMRAQF